MANSLATETQVSVCNYVKNKCNLMDYEFFFHAWNCQTEASAKTTNSKKRYGVNSVFKTRKICQSLDSKSQEMLSFLADGFTRQEMAEKLTG
jgi:hypothetical protein